MPTKGCGGRQGNPCGFDRGGLAALPSALHAQRVDQAAAKEQLREVVKAMEPRWPKAARVLAGGED